MKFIFLICSLVFVVACNNSKKEIQKEQKSVPKITSTSLVILGTTQDAGSPQIGCKKECCKNLFLSGDKSREVVSLGVIDTENKKTFLFEATPDMPSQLKKLNSLCPFNANETPDGIFLTHAHIGHYTGLMYLGKEAMNADSVTVYVGDRMKYFLETNGPWSQLVNKKNISLKTSLLPDGIFELNNTIYVQAFSVPHRDEFSETVGFIINGPTKKVLFIPDIDKWQKWDLSIMDEIAHVDYAFIDATFYDGNEIKNRDIKEIPHPFVIESMELFKDLPMKEKNKIYFIHFNHTNPLLNINSKQAKLVLQNGFNIAQKNDIFKL